MMCILDNLIIITRLFIPFSLLFSFFLFPSSFSSLSPSSLIFLIHLKGGPPGSLRREAQGTCLSCLHIAHLMLVRFLPSLRLVQLQSLSYDHISQTGVPYISNIWLIFLIYGNWRQMEKFTEVI